MEFEIEINLTEADKAEISAIIGCNTEELNKSLSPFFKASILEYLAMFRGLKVFKRGSDINEYRLLLLIENAFGGTIPDERTVSNLFQTNLTESRSLIRAVIAKYQYQLRPHIKQTLVTTLQSAARPNNTAAYGVIIRSQNIVDELNKALAEIDGTLPSVSKRKGSVSTYEIQPSSYDRLCEKLEMIENE
ncbi:hypothetical protein [Pseudomonas oryzihabitans]|uniref:hypothetical protein n=1 Tax=Pseudomonas oryzihabitans TaxID=47885 RepID=UPI003EBF2BC4